MSSLAAAKASTQCQVRGSPAKSPEFGAVAGVERISWVTYLSVLFQSHCIRTQNAFPICGMFAFWLMTAFFPSNFLLLSF